MQITRLRNYQYVESIILLFNWLSCVNNLNSLVIFAHEKMKGDWLWVMKSIWGYILENSIKNTCFHWFYCKYKQKEVKKENKREKILCNFNWDKY